ncbi:MAG: hypothetical protein IJ412_02315 [Oscillospiraceae bacterium]|nr:hypothetical protein [Oscillospiraceae bacterium]
MKEMEFQLNALVDFPDDCWQHPFDRNTLRSLFEKLVECRVKNLYWYWYGTRQDKWFWDHHNPQAAPGVSGTVQTALNMPNFNRDAAEIAHELGLNTVAVLRLLENGNAATYSEFYPEVRENMGKQALPWSGGYILDGCDYVYKHPEHRIKRRTWDIDETAEQLPICAIELQKANGRPTRIRKEDLTIYVSDNNAHYKKYEGDFNFTVTAAAAQEDVEIITQGAEGWLSKGYGRRRLTAKGEPVTVIRLDGFTIPERCVAVSCRSGAPYDEEDQDMLFVNTMQQGIRCYAADGRRIPAAVGTLSQVWRDPCGRDWRECGLGFDQGFGDSFENKLDPVVGEGVWGVCRGKNRYAHTTLCECEPGVQALWTDMLRRCIDDGFQTVTHRVENHSLMMDEPFAYGYNDSVKKLYWERFGKCEEKDMLPERIAKVRGDVYSELFKKGAQMVHAAGRKVSVQLNAEMLHDPIPMERRFAYPMNVEWQWERWLEETRPDAISLRTFRFSPEFVLRDPQCRRLIETARSYGVPIAYERYVNFGDFIEEYKLIRESGLFDSMTLYETAGFLKHTGGGKFEEVIPGLADKLKAL